MQHAQPQPERPLRPVTRSAAILTVQDVYQQNDWNDDEQLRHQLKLGLEDKPLNERENGEIKTILEDFEKARMVIFRD